MASKKAHGNTVATLVKISKNKDGGEVRNTYYVMEDRVVLSKLQIEMSATPYSPGKLHSYGIKKFGKIKEGCVDSWVQKRVSDGYTQK